MRTILNRNIIFSFAMFNIYLVFISLESTGNFFRKEISANTSVEFRGAFRQINEKLVSNN